MRVNEGDLYTSSATLSGLAVFGSVLGIKLGKSPEAHIWENMGMTVIVGSLTALIILQGIVMLKACCLNFDLLELYMLQGGTVLCLIGILMGFAVILEPSLNSQSQNPAKSSSSS